MLTKIETEVRSRGLIGFDGKELDFRSPRAWAALTIRPSKEQDAADWLKLARLFAYWPCAVKQSNSGGHRPNGFSRRRARFTAIIPGYIFIASHIGSDADPWAIVHQTPGVVGYVRDGTGRPALVSESDIERIRHIEAEQNLPFDPKTAHKFKVADKVRFCGDLFGIWPPGCIVRLADDGRISVEIPMLGRAVPIWVYPFQIEAM